MNTRIDPIRVVAADDHPLFREGIAALLGECSDIKLVGEASNGRDAVLKYRELLPDVMLMDLQMPLLGGLEALIEIRGEFKAARIVVLTTFGGDVRAQKAIKAGAQGYVLKSEVREELAPMIRIVHQGMRRIDVEIAQELAQHTLEDPLSDREVAVLELAAHGNSNKVIARRLEIAEGTVKSHMQHVLAKLQATDRTHAVSLAVRRGIISL